MTGLVTWFKRSTLGAGLRARLMVLVLLAAVPALLLTFYTGLERMWAEAEQGKDEALRLARATAAWHESLVDATEHFLTSIAEVPAIRDGRAAACASAVRRVIGAQSVYTTIRVFDADGELVCSSVPAEPAWNAAGRSYFERARKTRLFVTGEFGESASAGSSSLVFAFPVLDDRGAVTRVITTTANLGWMTRLVRETRPTEGWTMTVIDDRGTILAGSPDPDRTVARRFPMWRGLSDVLERRGESTAEAVGEDGIVRLYAVRELGSSSTHSAHVIVGVRKHAVIAAEERLLLRNLAGIGGVALLAVIAVVIGGEVFILRQVRALVTATRRLSSGDFNARTGLPYGGGELGQLAWAFDLMAESLGIQQEEAARTEHSLRQSEQRFQLTVLATNDAIWDWDLIANTMWHSEGMSRLFGYASDQVGVESAWWFERIHADDRPGVLERLRRAFEGRDESWSAEYRRRRADGAFAHVLDRGHIVRDAYGEPVRMVGAVMDVTERKRAEEQLGQQHEALVRSEKLAAMGQLLAGVAHELNNPLAVVIGRAELLRQLLDGTALATHAEKVSESAERCGRIVRNFLALARRRTARRQPMRLNDVVREALELIAYRFRVDDIDIDLRLEDDLPELSGDPDQLHQMIVNLVTNAHHAMLGSMDRRLTIVTDSRRVPGHVVLVVADTGPGIAAEHRARIFEPFFTTKPVGQGTGLGLPLCQSIVEGHGGTIRVESAPGQGAAFVIELPVGVVPSADVSATPEPAPTVHGRRLLIVDDEPEVAALLRALFVRAGNDAVVARNGREALDLIDRGRFDAVLCDVKMPEMNGPALYQALRRVRPDLLARIAFITGDALSAETKAFLDESGVPYLTKPFTSEEVMRVLTRIVAAADTSGPVSWSSSTSDRLADRDPRLAGVDC